MATKSLGRVSIVPQGDYDENQVYKRLDLVKNDGKTYLSLKEDNTDVLSDADSWMLITESGRFEDLTPQELEALLQPLNEATNSANQAAEAANEATENALTGISGEATQSNSPEASGFHRYIVTTPITTGSAWGIEVTQAELDGNWVFFNVKDGVITKETKPNLSGKSAYQLAVDAGFVGTEAEWRESLKGEDGESGVAFKYLNSISQNEIATAKDFYSDDNYFINNNILSDKLSLLLMEFRKEPDKVWIWFNAANFNLHLTIEIQYKDGTTLKTDIPSKHWSGTFYTEHTYDDANVSVRTKFTETNDSLKAATKTNFEIDLTKVSNVNTFAKLFPNIKKLLFKHSNIFPAPDLQIDDLYRYDGIITGVEYLGSSQSQQPLTPVLKFGKNAVSTFTYTSSSILIKLTPRKKRLLVRLRYYKESSGSQLILWTSEKNAHEGNVIDRTVVPNPILNQWTEIEYFATEEQVNKYKENGQFAINFLGGAWYSDIRIYEIDEIEPFIYDYFEESFSGQDSMRYFIPNTKKVVADEIETMETTTSVINLNMFSSPNPSGTAIYYDGWDDKLFFMKNGIKYSINITLEN